MSEVNREAVKVGIDFRPLPLDLGDGNIWLFNPAPESAEFGALQDTLTGIASSADDADGDPSKIPSLIELSDRLQDALLPLMTDDDQREKFAARNYGFTVLQKLTVVLMEQLTGFPTQPPAPSGAKRGGTGSRTSRGGTGKG